MAPHHHAAAADPRFPRTHQQASPNGPSAEAQPRKGRMPRGGLTSTSSSPHNTHLAHHAGESTRSPAPFACPIRPLTSPCNQAPLTRLRIPRRVSASRIQIIRLPSRHSPRPRTPKTSRPGRCLRTTSRPWASPATAHTARPQRLSPAGIRACLPLIPRRRCTRNTSCTRSRRARKPSLASVAKRLCHRARVTQVRLQ